MSIPVLRKADAGRYYAYWSEGKRSCRKSMGTADGDVAQARFAHWLIARQMVADESPDALTIGELWAIYEAKHIDVEVASPDTAKNSWKNMKPHFGAMVVSDLTADTVAAYVTKRTSGKLGRASKPATIRRELAALVACLNWCANPRRKPRLLTKADVPLIDLPRDSEPRDRWLTKDEIDRMLSAAAAMSSEARMSRGERFLWLALETAARKQAIMDLTWDRVDWQTGMINFDVPGRRKTKKRRVAVPISSSLRPMLERAYRERTGDLVMDHGGAIWATIQSITIRAGLGERGQPAGPTRCKPLATGISPHTLRHTAATQMARRGVPLYDIAGVLGNTMVMVEKVYAKHCPGRLRAAVNSITGDDK